MPHATPGLCEVCGRPRATTEIAEHTDDGLCWAIRFYGGHDPGEILNALRAERSRTLALAAEVEALKAQLASTEDSIRAMAPKPGHEGGHGCGCGGYDGCSHSGFGGGGD